MLKFIFDSSLLFTPIGIDVYDVPNRRGVARFQLHIFGVRVASWVKFKV